MVADDDVKKQMEEMRLQAELEMKEMIKKDLQTGMGSQISRAQTSEFRAAPPPMVPAAPPSDSLAAV